MPGQDLGLPSPDCLGQASELGHVALAAVVVEAAQAATGLLDVVGREHLTQQLLGQIRGPTSPSGSPASRRVA